VKIIIKRNALGENLTEALDEYFDTHLGPKIVQDAKRYCPVSARDAAAGHLVDSIEHHLDNHALIVSASGNDERTYAYYVETGHRVYHPSTGAVGPESVPPQPFLRPALYQQRD
jgi:hypothetical protein